MTGNKTTEQIAAELKDRLRTPLQEICMVMDEAVRAGLLVQWDNIGIGQYLTHQVNGLRIVKHY